MSSNKELVQQFFVKERAAQRRAIVMTWTLVAVADILALMAYLQGATLRSIATGLAGALGAVLLLLFWRVRQRTTLQERLTRLLNMDVHLAFRHDSNLLQHGFIEFRVA